MKNTSAKNKYIHFMQTSNQGTSKLGAFCTESSMSELYPPVLQSSVVLDPLASPPHDFTNRSKAFKEVWRGEFQLREAVGVSECVYETSTFSYPLMLHSRRSVSPMVREMEHQGNQIVALKFHPCHVCARPAHGNHFGAISCRACAAFFRRAKASVKTTFKCKKSNNCQIWQNGRFICKKCRLDRCNAIGMDPGKFQFDRDPLSATMKGRDIKLFSISNLPETVEHFLGRPHFIVWLGPQQPFTEKNFVDCQPLIEKASKLLQFGSEKPLTARSNLEKMALGRRLLREKLVDAQELQLVTKWGKDETLSLWESDFLIVAKCFTYFDDFQQLPHDQQVLLLKSFWHVWGRLDKLSMTASNRLKNICEQRQMMVSPNSACDPKTVELDLSWITRCSKQQFAFFFDEMENWLVVEALEPLMELQPTEVELTYMLCQLCFHYSGKRFQGEIMKITERFQERLANDLHGYYVNELRMTRYSSRLNRMLKINNMIQQDIWKMRAKQEMAKFFDIFCVEFSHPEMFEDSA